MKTAIPLLHDVMTPAPRSVAAGASLKEAAELMRSLDVHHLPVVEAGDVVSVVSEREILRFSGPSPAFDADGLVVGDVCHHRCYAADVDDPLDRILDIMVEKHLDAVLVMRDGELAGIFTATDACRALAIHLRKGIGEAQFDE